MSSSIPPSDLVDAIETLWRLRRAAPSNLYAAPAFVQLREACQRLYPNAGSRQALDLALSQALHAFGFPPRLDDARLAALPLPPKVAASRLDRAFRQSQCTRTHLCPLDLGDTIPALTFGPNQIRTFSAGELDELVNPNQLARSWPSLRFDSERFSQFSWLIVRETVELGGRPGARSLPSFFFDAREDFGRIEPHKRRFPAAVEEALFALLTVPWEDVTIYGHEWRAFCVPWCFTIDDDLFARPQPPPDAATLSWEPDFIHSCDGELVEIERPTCLRLEEDAASAASYLNDKAWAELVEAHRSPLLAGPVTHFLVRAFLTDGIDEFLAHITVVEAALGLSKDHSGKERHKRPNVNRCDNNPGATDRVGARIAALLDDQGAGDTYKALFKQRSLFLHGRGMADIPSLSRFQARRIARKTVCGLVGAAIATPAPANREVFLDELLSKGWRLS